MEPLVLLSAQLFDFFFFLNVLCTIHLDEDTKFCQYLHSFKATVSSPCKARESAGKHTWRQESCEFSFRLCQHALCSGKMSPCPSTLLVNQERILQVGLYVIWYAAFRSRSSPVLSPTWTCGGTMVRKKEWIGGEDNVVHTLWWVESVSLAFVSMPPHTL